MDKAKTCAFQANYHLIWAVKYRRSVLFGPVEVRLVEVLKVIAGQCGFKVLACRVHDGDHVHVFVSAPPKVGIPMMVRVLKCNSARMLFVEFSALKLKLWGGQLWSDGYAAALQVRLPAQKSKNISIGIEISGCLQRKLQVVHWFYETSFKRKKRTNNRSKKTRRKRKKHYEVGKKYKPQLYWKNMETMPHNRIIQTQTIQRQQQKNNPANRRKNQTNHKRKTRHHPTRANR